MIKAGKAVPLAITATKRHPAFPDIRTFTEQGFPDMRGDTWFWLAGPKGLSPQVVGALNAEFRRINKTPKMTDYFNRLALSTMDLDSAAVAKFVADEYAFWAPLAKDVGLKVQ
jgi:tripartite-type tricarboxylate transporter receptor subunit TctC